MKRTLFVLLLAVSAVSCVTKENFDIQPGSPDLEVTLDAVTGDTAGIDTTVFALLDLDRPELIGVKGFYEKGDIYSAAEYLLRYYRQRSLINPSVSTIAKPSVTSEMQSIADQATKKGGYRFRVSDFYEDRAQNTCYSFAVKEGENVTGINWDIQPSMPEDDQFSSQLHRHQWMLDQAKVYKATGDEKYVQAWIDVYFDWVKKHPCGEGKTWDIPWWGLQPPSRAEDQMSILEYYKNSELFTPAVLTNFLVSFHTHIKNIMSNWYEEEGSNVRKSQEKVVYMAGILMPEFKDSESWYKAGLDAAQNVEKQFYADGGHNEFTPHYHIGAVSDYYDIYKLASVNGLMADLSGNFMSVINKAAGFVKNIMYPDYSIEVICDTKGNSWTEGVLVKNFLKYAEMFPEDDEFRWIASKGVEGTKPRTTLAVYPESGFYMMRNGWDRESVMLIHKNSYDPKQKWTHNQSDNGHISLYVKGRHFLPDAGFYSYGTREGNTELDKLREQFRATSMHNTITKEGSDLIERREGRLLKTETAPDYELVVTENPAYSDLTHRRAIFFVDNRFFVVVDEAYGTNEGKVNLNFNLWGGEGLDAEKIPVDGTDATAIDEYEGMNCGGAHSLFNDGNNLLLRTFSETSDDFALDKDDDRYFSVAENKQTRRYWYEVSVTKKADKAARFITVILPFGNVADFAGQNISASFIDNPDPEDAGTFHGNDGAAVKVTINGNDYSLSYNLN